MSKADTAIRCVDAVVTMGMTFVVIERLGSMPGLALIGGKIDPGETAEEAILREVYEETGLRLIIQGLLGVYDDPDRDPRGRYISSVYFGEAYGIVRPETGKTRVLLLPYSEIKRRRSDFIADHFKILQEFARKNGFD